MNYCVCPPHPNRSAELTTKPSPSEGGGKGEGDEEKLALPEDQQSLSNEIVRKGVTNFRNPPSPPFLKGGWGDFEGTDSNGNIPVGFRLVRVR